MPFQTQQKEVLTFTCHVVPIPRRFTRRTANQEPFAELIRQSLRIIDLSCLLLLVLTQETFLFLWNRNITEGTSAKR